MKWEEGPSLSLRSTSDIKHVFGRLLREHLPKGYLGPGHRKDESSTVPTLREVLVSWGRSHSPHPEGVCILIREVDGQITQW